MSFGQNTHLSIAVSHIEKQAEKWNLKPSDYKDLLISSEVTTEKVSPTFTLTKVIIICLSEMP